MVGPASVAAATVATASKAPGREHNASTGTHTFVTRRVDTALTSSARSPQMLRKDLKRRNGLHPQRRPLALLRY